MRTSSFCRLVVLLGGIGCASSSEPDVDAWNSSLQVEVAYQVSVDSMVLATVRATNTGLEPLERG